MHQTYTYEIALVFKMYAEGGLIKLCRYVNVG